MGAKSESERPSLGRERWSTEGGRREEGGKGERASREREEAIIPPSIGGKGRVTHSSPTKKQVLESRRESSALAAINKRDSILLLASS